MTVINASERIHHDSTVDSLRKLSEQTKQLRILRTFLEGKQLDKKIVSKGNPELGQQVSKYVHLIDQLQKDIAQELAANFEKYESYIYEINDKVSRTLKDAGIEIKSEK
jgi:hypothetical protein